VSERSPEAAGRKARTAAVRRARNAIARLIADELERKNFEESVARYADAVAMGAALRVQWAELGSPTMAEGSMRQPIPHPMVKMIADADAAAAKYAAAVGLDASVRGKAGVRGRPVGSVSAPDRSAPARIVRVK
jgi:hypothetical protein